jgi:hypothetical protein
MKSQHILQASSNCYRLRTHLSSLLDAAVIQLITDEINANAVQLVKLGLTHYRFAKRTHISNWRQIVSRLYYAAYNMVRGVRLLEDGSYSTDSSDHKRIDALPETFPHKDKYINQLPSLRDDRNLSDYDHTAAKRELIISIPEAFALVNELQKDVRTYFHNKGVKL